MMAPIATALMVGVGWVGAMQILGLVVLLSLPAAFLLKGNSLQAAPAGHKVVGTREAIRTALRHPSYLMLGAGFFVCGFHVAFLATHMPGVIAMCGSEDLVYTVEADGNLWVTDPAVGTVDKLSEGDFRPGTSSKTGGAPETPAEARMSAL